MPLGNDTGTGGRAETGLYPATVETARIVNVNVEDYTVDCVGEYGNRRHTDVQIMSPYLHYANGEGWYVMPEVGALCWICQESAGYYARKFVLGFQAPFDERDDQTTGLQAGNFKSNRQNLNPGDQMWKGRDENFVILRRGGVLQIGSTPAAQRIYMPLNNIIKDYAFSYELRTLAGEMLWETARQEEDDAGDVKTRFRLRSKTRSNEKEHAAILTIGSHEDDEDLRLSLEIKPTGAEGELTVIQLQMTKDGDVSWALERDYTLSAKRNLSLLSLEGDLSLQADSGKVLATAFGSVEIESTGSFMDLTSQGEMSLQGSGVNVKGSTINLDGKTKVGGSGGEPIVKGTQLAILLKEILSILSTNAGLTVPPGFPIAATNLAPLVAKVDAILSTNNTTT